ncbi:MAG: hypothetical protein ABEH35_06395 [Haloarculaceae archaeon]
MFRGTASVTKDQAEDEFSHILRDGEELQHAMASTEGIEYTKDGRKTSIEPREYHALALVTDRRILFLVGDENSMREPEIELNLLDVTEVEQKDSFLSSSFFVSDGYETVRFVPEEGDAGQVVSYIERIGSNWRGLQSVLDSAREEIKMYRIKKDEGSDTTKAERRVENRIDRARSAANKYVDAPNDLLHAEVEEIVEEFEEARTDSRIRELEQKLDAVADADDHEAVCETLAEVDERLSEVRSAVDDEDKQATLDEIEAELETRVSEYVDAAVSAHEAATDSEPPESLEQYEAAFQRFRAASRMGLPATNGLDPDEKHRTVGTELIEQLEQQAEQFEAAGDEAGDDVEDEYERAKTALEHARSIAEDVPDVDPARFDEDIDRLDEAVERSKWQWGAS